MGLWEAGADEGDQIISPIEEGGTASDPMDKWAEDGPGHADVPPVTGGRIALI